MTAESILERINQKPFRPIALETVTERGSKSSAKRIPSSVTAWKQRPSSSLTPRAHSSFSSQSKSPQLRQGEEKALLQMKGSGAIPDKWMFVLAKW